MSVTWTNELTDMLIDLYYTQRVLWDLSDKNYKNKNMKKDAWKTISDAMGLHDLEIQRKIKNLTAQFFREKKKIKNDNKSGTTASDTPRWFAYQRLLFLTGRSEPRICMENIINEPDDNGPERGTEEKISQNESLVPSEIVEINDMLTVQISPDSQPTGLQPDRRKNVNGSKRKKSSYVQRQEASYKVFKKLQAEKPRNRFFIFGELVATKIEALQSSYAQNVVEHLISNILFEASIGNYDYPAFRQMTPLSTHSSNSRTSIHTHLTSPNSSINPSSPSPQFEYRTNNGNITIN